MDESPEVLTLIDEDGEEQDFAILDIVELEGSRYAILLPLDEEGEEEDEGEAIILKYAKDEEGNEILTDIEDDEEWERVADAWEEMIIEEK
ncbi:MAG: DUF1292 domain-containing protein [Armatimonadetes bacterium]|nr:DUF1292 domain-containing protein [Armatimonadota bacterium]